MAFEYITILSIAFVAAAVVIWPATVICRRLGYSAYLGFLAIVPFANLALLWFVAFSPWAMDQGKEPAARRSWHVRASLRTLRERLQMIGLPQKP
ncbi:MAG TPA: hypothetical protein VGQ65_19785 [Thermoanaerobaculia bacterium]|jgi:hypothetical protein|nr:hypothetical protein [Thermoanaerobaculia bacterium]